MTKTPTHSHPKVKRNPPLLFHKPDLDVSPDDEIPVATAARALGISRAQLEELVDEDHLDETEDEGGHPVITGDTWLEFVQRLRPVKQPAHADHTGPADAADGPDLYSVECPRCRHPNPFVRNTKTMTCHGCGTELRVLGRDEADGVPAAERRVAKFLHKLGSFVETGRVKDLEEALPALPEER